nr:serine protease inhibitor Kazal-type 2 isoform X1 [Equus asinus]
MLKKQEPTRPTQPRVRPERALRLTRALERAVTRRPAAEEGWRARRCAWCCCSWSGTWQALHVLNLVNLQNIEDQTAISITCQRVPETLTLCVEATCPLTPTSVLCA